MTLTEMEQRLKEIVRQAWELYSEADNLRDAVVVALEAAEAVQPAAPAPGTPAGAGE